MSLQLCRLDSQSSLQRPIPHHPIKIRLVLGSERGVEQPIDVVAARRLSLLLIDFVQSSYPDGIAQLMGWGDGSAKHAPHTNTHKTLSHIGHVQMKGAV